MHIDHVIHAYIIYVKPKIHHEKRTYIMSFLLYHIYETNIISDPIKSSHQSQDQDLCALILFVIIIYNYVKVIHFKLKVIYKFKVYSAIY